MRLGYRLIPVVSLLAIGLVSAQANAYQTLKESTGTTGETYWYTADLPVRYFIYEAGTPDVSGDGEFTSIQNAFNTWTKPACTGLRFVYGGKTADRVAWGDGINTLEWVEVADEWPAEAGSKAIAITLPELMANGRFYEADISFNGVDYSWSTSGSWGKMDVETIAVHEIGHFLGLADLYDDTSCYSTRVIMCGYNNGETKRALKTDDSNGVCYLYPKGRAQLCTTDADCATNYSCGPQVALDGKTVFSCLPVRGKALPGEKCGDVKNTPGEPSDDVFCRNSMCLDSMVCTKTCQSDADCPYNMPCGDTGVTTDSEERVAEFRGCSTPPGCVRNAQCDNGAVCGFYRAGDSYAQACIALPGEGVDGMPCSKWDDCASAICSGGYCASLCDDTMYCPQDVPDGVFSCVFKSITGQDGKKGGAFVCSYKPNNPPVDGGVPDSGTQPPDGGTVDPDSGTVDPDGGPIDPDAAVPDDGGQPVDCTCDLNWGCDPDCSCDPECSGANGAVSGCACSSVSL
ncbi:MAG: matrixin family metalloprotease [Myxococcota bacterium]